MGIPEDAAETVVLAGVVTAGDIPGNACDEGVKPAERGLIPAIFAFVLANTGTVCFKASIMASVCNFTLESFLISDIRGPE